MSNRNARREFKRLQGAVDKATASDRLFFERRPDRQHRLRHAHSAEVRQEEIAGGGLDLKPGMTAFAVIRNLCAGSRLRLLLQSWEGTEVDVDEATARAIFELYADDKVRLLEAEMRALACGI